MLDRSYRVYLAGPMSGYEGYNYSSFHAIEKMLTEYGWTVINPAAFEPPEVENWEEYMRITISQLMQCGRVATLPNWQESRGACLEVSLAHALAIPVKPYDKFENLRLVV